MTLVSGSELLFVSQVAPYVDGPPGSTACSTRPRSASPRSRASTTSRARASTTCGRCATTIWPGRALALFTIGETPWSEAQRTTIVDRLRGGELAVLAIHSATDSCYGWADYGCIVGARFDGHPWTETVDLEVADPAHPATAHLGASWRWHDEVYQFRDLRDDARILLRVPPSSLDLQAPGAGNPAFGFPLSWCFDEGKGRTFSTSLGHFPGAWESPAYLRHLSGGLEWALDAGN